MKCKKCRAFSADFHARSVRKRPDKGRNPGRFNFTAVARVCIWSRIGVIGRLFGASGFAVASQRRPADLGCGCWPETCVQATGLKAH
ncbi:MAG: hypothetical protein COC12_01320 [Rhodobacteraceae bacterium]|nr:MAG: hypothetical protein COC12_01320 [Paracoccaceae bacterium]